MSVSVPCGDELVSPGMPRVTGDIMGRDTRGRQNREPAATQRSQATQTKQVSLNQQSHTINDFVFLCLPFRARLWGHASLSLDCGHWP